MPESLISHTAVLYFSLSSKTEAKSKTFASEYGYQANVRIAGLLRDHSHRQITHSGLPCYIFDEKNQKGESFGEKLVNAFVAVFEKGYDHVITVGNDTPGLNSKHLSKSSELLRNGDASVVLGPASDGGTWLMGFSRDAFNPETLKSLPWNSSDLFSSIIRNFDAVKNIEVLEYFDDVDHSGDLKKFLTVRPANSHIKRLHQNITGILSSFYINTPAKIPSLVSRYFKYSFLLRGPPSISGTGRFTS